jgi:formamidopyrimidine-DNA glycosylase
METYCRLLTDKIAGARITKIEVNREKSINVPINEFVKRVSGHIVQRVERRAKHLLFFLENDEVLLLHLMLGGWMYYGTGEDKPKRTIQVQLDFSDHSLYFLGLRLGYLHLYALSEIEDRLADLGPEPLSDSFSLAWFRDAIRHKRGRLKPILVDQKFISGIGNCYSDEICFDAALLPGKKTAELSKIDISQLHQSIRSVLSEAVANGGYMETFFAGDRLTGGFDLKCKVYDREGELCVRCLTPIVKDKLASRKVFYCPQCQH